MNTLREFISEYQISPAELARRCRIPVSTVKRILDDRPVDWADAQAIESGTFKRVLAADLMREQRESVK